MEGQKNNRKHKSIVKYFPFSLDISKFCLLVEAKSITLFYVVLNICRRNTEDYITINGDIYRILLSTAMESGEHAGTYQ